MGVLIGLLIAVGSLIGGFAAMGGHIAVLWQPWELVIILGTAIGTYIIANPMKTVADTGTAVMEAMRNATPSQAHYFEVLGLLYALMRELRNKGRAEIEQHIETPYDSTLFANYPSVLADRELTTFICDYFRLIIVGKAQAHEVEALLDEEIAGHLQDSLKPYYALGTVAEALPALGIVAAVLGVIKAMGAIDQSPALLGSFIGAALVGTFAGIFCSYAMVGPISQKIKTTREKQARPYIVVKQTLLAFIGGAAPQVALEYGRKVISAAERPSIDEVEDKTISGGGQRAPANDRAQKEAA
ncbi:flagellar motor stator protein MotA [Bosea sp. Root381]|uniref:flagellar motor stator protein MotA n=1 Tax=Bosea sp. Root381 TaxID=1736524 RepID=UPI000701F719|nr:flagellar motor stator protein MotA [Bosea sp. Root381]KRE15751.1 flagellar motor stator protein MotA [Bosea sp. Root381]